MVFTESRDAVCTGGGTFADMTHGSDLQSRPVCANQGLKVAGRIIESKEIWQGEKATGKEDG